MAKKNNKLFLTIPKKIIIYTLVIIFLSSFITYRFFLIKNPINDNPQENKQALNESNPQKDSYTERDSPYDNRSYNNSAQAGQVIFHGPRDKKKIALTFDAEMTDYMKANLQSGKVKSSYDKRIVDILNKTNTKATFFLTGMWIELYPNVTQELSQNPLFELGSHSYSDTSFQGYCFGLKQIPDTLDIEEIGATEKLLREYAGIDNQLFRFPGGCYSPHDVQVVNDANDIVVHWDVKGSDGFNDNAKLIEKNVVDNVQNGSIIILHLNGAPTAPKTADALPEIISSLKAKGYEFVKVNELLGLPTEQKSPNY